MGEPKRPKISEFSESNRNVEVTQIEFNDILSTIFQVIQGFDKYAALNSTVDTVVDGEKVQISGKTIKSKLKDSGYSNVLSFKDDISKICNRAIAANSINPIIQEQIQKMLQLATDLIADKSHYTIRSHGKKVRSREDTQTSLPPRDHEKFALFQRTNEGFVFTSKARGKDDLVEQDIPKTVIVPVASSSNPPTLKDVNSKLRNPRSTVPKKQTVGVDYRPSGPFTSFAPFIDSSNAEMNAEDTATAYGALLDRYFQKTQSSAGSDEQQKAKAQLESILQIAQQNQTSQEGTSTDLSEDDLAFLSEDGLDVRKLISLKGSQDSEEGEKARCSVLEAIQKNAMLLSELYKLQDERFASKNQTITAHEQELAAAVQQSLTDLAGKLTPSALVSVEAVEEAMKKLPYKETAFAGSLPPTKPFAFPTNATRNGMPPTATAYPTHNPVVPKKNSPALFTPAVVLSHHINMTGGYPTVPQSHHYSYGAPQQSTHQKTFSRPKSGNSSGASPIAPLQMGPGGEMTIRKKNDPAPCTSCGTLVSQLSAMAPINKKKVKSGEGINSRLALVMKSGKYQLGYKSTLKTLRQGKSKLVIISGNCPPLRKSEIEYYAMLSKTGVHHYTGTNVELGTACGKYFRVGVLSITDAGDSDIIKQQEASA
ncbi:60S ribosomal protein L30 [Podila epicladia]|nr:60S ribosomal protein L30 [Podila epicladia]